MTTILDGKVLAEKIRADVKQEVGQLSSKPGLAVVIVGDDPASHVYVRNKAKKCEEVGMASFMHVLPEATSEKDLLALVDKLNKQADVHGILVQLPLPDHINADAVTYAIDPEKDVDGFHPVNMGKLTLGLDTFVPCTPQGCMDLLDAYNIPLEGKKAVVIGRSNIVGKPMSLLLQQRHVTVTMAHSRTYSLEQECAQADIIVAAVGRPLMVKADWVKPGATLIDVGINRIDGEAGKSKLVGDIDYADVFEKAGFITPVPGGVGPLTIACLLRNTLKAFTNKS